MSYFEDNNPVRQRMIEDMTMRRLSPKTQIGYLRAVKRLATYLKRSPEDATAEELRQFQLSLAEDGTTNTTINATLQGLQFLFGKSLISSEPKATVVYNKYKSVEWTFENQTKAVLLNGILEKQLRDRLREELGAVYSVNINSDLSRWPVQRYQISVNFTCSPDNINPLVEEINNIFARTQAEGINETVLANVKTQILTERTNRLKTNEFWVNFIASHYSLFKPLELDKQESIVQSISAPELVEFAKNVLTTDTYVFATLTPERSD